MSLPNIRRRRVEQERRLAERFCAFNESLLSFEGADRDAASDAFRFVLRGTHGLLGPTAGEPLERHSFRLVFPRFFPTQPIEAYLERPVFHPNVDPDSGFVCLWLRPSVSDTVMEAIRRLQCILRWETWNADANHLMQPAALEWIAIPENRAKTPFEAVRLREDPEFREDRALFQKERVRRRLSR